MLLPAQNNDNGVYEAKSPHLANPDFLKISPYESGIAYYVDLHGHASKKGIISIHFIIKQSLESILKVASYMEIIYQMMNSIPIMFSLQN